MGRGRWGRLKIFAIVPLLGFLFWLSAALASGLVSTIVLGVDVHALNLPGYTGDPSQRPAPLSMTVVNDARQDARIGSQPRTSVASPKPAPSPSQSTTPHPTPSLSPLPVATPSSSPLPVVTPSSSPLPLPSLPVLTASPTPGSATISGQVTDSQTNLPIIGASVSLSPGGASTLTDASGNFSLRVGPGTYTVTASAAAYNSASQSVSLSAGQTATVAFKLVAIVRVGAL